MTSSGDGKNSMLPFCYFCLLNNNYNYNYNKHLPVSEKTAERLRLLFENDYKNEHAHMGHSSQTSIKVNNQITAMGR